MPEVGGLVAPGPRTRSGLGTPWLAASGETATRVDDGATEGRSPWS